MLGMLKAIASSQKLAEINQSTSYPAIKQSESPIATTSVLVVQVTITSGENYKGKSQEKPLHKKQPM